jgi:hypothetical protein
MGVYEQMVARQRTRTKETDRVASARAKFIADPGKVDAWVAKTMQEHLPEGARVQTTKHPTKTEAVSAGFSSDDPRAGLGDTIKQSYNKLATAPELSAYGPTELLTAATQLHMGDVAPATHQYTREQGAALLGGDAVRPMAGYDEWLAGQQGAEAAVTEAEGEARLVGDAPAYFGLGAGFAAAGQGIARTRAGQATVKAIAKPASKVAAKLGFKAFTKLASRGLMAAPHPIAKIVGAGLLAIPEFFAFDKAHELITRSEWGQANKESGKVLAAEMLLPLAPAVGVGAVTRKLLKGSLKGALEADLLSTRAKRQLSKSPTASNIIMSHALDVEKKKAASRVNSVMNLNRGEVDSILAKVETNAALAERAAVTSEIAPAADKLAISQREATYAPTKAARSKAAKEANKFVAELEGISAKSNASIPELETFKVQMRTGEIETRMGQLEQSVKKAAKSGDDASIAAFENELVTLHNELGVLAERFAIPTVRHDAAVKAFQLAEIEKGLASASDEGVVKALAGTKARLENEIDNIVAGNLSRVSDDGMEAVERKLAVGKSPLVATSEVNAAEKVIEEQAVAKAPVKMDAIETATISAEAEKDALVQKIYDAATPTMTKGKIKTPAAKASEVRYAKKVGVKGADSMSRAELLDATYAAEEASERALVKGLETVEKAQLESVVGEQVITKSGIDKFVPSKVTFDEKNLPPFVKLKSGAINEREYAALMADEQVRKAEYDLLVKEAPEHVMAEWSKLQRKLRPGTEALEEEVKVATKAAREEAKRGPFGEPTKKELALLEEEMAEVSVKDTVAANANVAQSGADPAAVKVMDDTLEAGEALVVGREAERAAISEADALAKKAGKSSLKSILAIAGPSASALILADAIAPSESEASFTSVAAGKLSGAAKTMFAEATGKAAKSASQLKKVAEVWKAPTVAPGQKALPAKVVSYSNPPPKNINLNRKRLPFFLDRIFSPHTVGEFYYDAHHNPAVEIAGRITAAHNDTQAALTVTRNILDTVPGAGVSKNLLARNEVIHAMAPLEKTYGKTFARAGHAEGMLGELRARAKQIKKKAAKGQEGFEDELALLAGELAKFESVVKEEAPRLAQFQREWEAAVKPLAAKHSSTRIALAIEDTADHTVHPWMKGMLSFEEREAVAHFKTMMQEIGGRIQAAGGQTIKERPYIHHAMHPNKNFNEVKAALGDIAYDVDGSPIYSKIHSRMLGSRQMVPEVGYIMERYLPDVSKRVQMMDFWKKAGWEKHSKEVSQHSEALRVFWETIKEGFKPHDNTFGNKLARQYTSFEVFRLLALSPSVAFKHLVKVSATMAQFPLATTVSILPRSVKAAVKIGLNRNYNNSWLAKRVGGRISLTEQEQLIDSLTKQGHYIESIADMNVADIPRKGVGMLVNKMNEIGSMPVRAVELFDRAHVVLAGMEMSGKQGMTAQQSLEAMFKTVLQNNFLGGNQNPAWLRNPKIRAVMMFQGTPFKILERRLLVAAKSKQGLDAAGKEMLKQLGDLKKNIKEGEKLFKAELIKDALLGPKDQYSQPYAKTFMKELLGLGAFVAVGHDVANVDLHAHAFHLPVVRFEATGPSIALNPVLQEAYRTSAFQDDDDFWMSQFFKNYFKGVGLSNTFTKAVRLGKGDIPARYLDAANPELAYLFAVPAPAK